MVLLQAAEDTLQLLKDVSFTLYDEIKIQCVVCDCRKGIIHMFNHQIETVNISDTCIKNKTQTIIFRN
jgi:hypothetical protein